MKSILTLFVFMMALSVSGQTVITGTMYTPDPSVTTVMFPVIADSIDISTPHFLVERGVVAFPFEPVTIGFVCRPENHLDPKNPTFANRHVGTDGPLPDFHLLEPGRYSIWDFYPRPITGVSLDKAYLELRIYQ